MAHIVRKCTKCNAIDGRQSWKSSAAAVDDDALERWTCPSCAWPEAELVEAEPETAAT